MKLIQGIKEKFSILNFGFKYPSMYEKRDIYTHKIIPDSMLGESENVSFILKTVILF